MTIGWYCDYLKPYLGGIEVNHPAIGVFCFAINGNKHIPRQVGKNQWCSQDEQITWAQHGDIELRHAPTMKILLHSEVASEAAFAHKYHYFCLTCMLASRPHKVIAHANN